MRRGWWAPFVALILVIVAGCTGVPGSSGPQVVRSVGLGEAPAPSPAAPPVGADIRGIVYGFLNAMATSPDRLDAARAYLDAEAAQKWQSSPVFIARNDTLNVRSADETHNTVTVSYQSVGSLSAAGVYTPVLAGSGVSSPPNVTYNLAKNAQGQWRITTPVPAGLFITEDDYASLYSPRPLYFLDLAGTRLVPDLRYSALTGPSVETYLLGQLIAGPRVDLAGAVSQFDPQPTNNQRLTVTPGNPTVVQVPGASALDGQSAVRLAAQLAFTLRTSSFESQLQIQDGKQVVSIEGVGDTFDSTDFPGLAPVDESRAVTATYVRGGAVVDPTGKPVAGVLGTPQYALQSAVFDDVPGRTRVAGTTRSSAGDGLRLLVGDPSGLSDVGVPTGPLTTPVWAPLGSPDDADEVWTASGSKIYRFVAGVRGARPASVYINPAGFPAGGTITALSFSPEGTRLALVVTTGSATAQAYTAAVVRNGPNVQVTGLVPVTPVAFELTDVGWIDETRLAAVGSAPGYPIGVYLEFSVDGSRRSVVSPDGLPERPRTLAVSPQAAVEWVTVGTGSDTSVWTKSTTGRTWSPPSGGALQAGYGPSFSA